MTLTLLQTSVLNDPDLASDKAQDFVIVTRPAFGKSIPVRSAGRSGSEGRAGAASWQGGTQGRWHRTCVLFLAHLHAQFVSACCLTKLPRGRFSGLAYFQSLVVGALGVHVPRSAPKLLLLFFCFVLWRSCPNEAVEFAHVYWCTDFANMLECAYGLHSDLFPWNEKV